MKYVIYLKLDDAFQKRYQKYCNVTGFKPDFPGHISLVACKALPQNFEDLIGSLILKIRDVNITFHSLSMFLTNEKILYLSAAKTQSLADIQKTIYSALEGIVVEEFKSHYQSSNWVPHSTIGWPFDPKQFDVLFSLDHTNWEGHEFKVEAVELAETNPFKVIQSIQV